MNDFTPQPADQAPQGEQPHDQAQQPQAQQAGAQQAGAQHEQPGTDGQTAAGSQYTQGSGQGSGQGSYQQQQQHFGSGPLYRPYEGRMGGGVAAGIAQYLGVDPTLIRIAFVVLTFIGGAGIPVYVAGWLLIPDEETGQSLASEFISSLQSRPS